MDHSIKKCPSKTPVPSDRYWASEQLWAGRGILTFLIRFSAEGKRVGEQYSAALSVCLPSVEKFLSLKVAFFDDWSDVSRGIWIKLRCSVNTFAP